jgi:hypothetical protein
MGREGWRLVATFTQNFWRFGALSNTPEFQGIGARINDKTLECQTVCGAVGKRASSLTMRSKVIVY